MRVGASWGFGAGIGVGFRVQGLRLKAHSGPQSLSKSKLF